MKTTETKITEIVDRIQSRNDVVELIDESKLQAFIRSAIDQDTIVSYLFFKTAFDESTVGLMIYICTNCRLVKLQISDKALEHSSAVLSEITDISKRTVGGEWDSVSEIGVQVKGKQVFGFKYQDGDRKIENFFERIKDNIEMQHRTSTA